MRSLPLLALVSLSLAACGSDTPSAPPTPAPAADATSADATAPTQPPAATEGRVSCDSFADHMLEHMHAQAEAAGDNEFMTVDQSKVYATAMVDGIRVGCKTDNRLSEFPEVATCYMQGASDSDWQACKAMPKGEAFAEYMAGLLRGSIDLEPGTGD